MDSDEERESWKQPVGTTLLEAVIGFLLIYYLWDPIFNFVRSLIPLGQQ